MLQLGGRDPFLELTQHELGCAEVFATREEVLGQLLCDGRTTTFLVARQHAVCHTEQGLRVDARVLGEALILDADEGFRHVMRELGITHVAAVFHIIGTQNLAVGRVDLGSQVGPGVFQFLEGGHGAKDTRGDADEEENDKQHQRPEDDPQVSDGMRLIGFGFLFIVHGIIVCRCKVRCRRCLSTRVRAWLVRFRNGRFPTGGRVGSR